MKRRFLAGVLALTAAAATLAPPPLAPPAIAQAGLSQSDKAAGGKAYQEIVRQFGGKVEGPLADYVRSVGLKVALAASPGSRPADWTITLLNSPVPNAMATPGGYLYITRGLVAMMNSEAELASVLGHEAGHVAARHSDKRNSRAALGGIATIAAAILGGSQVAELTNLGTSALVSGYSRSQENEADRLGMRYSIAAGYDPRAAATMLEALDRVEAVEGRERIERGGVASIFSTHPVTAERVQRVRAEALETGRTGALNRDQFLTAIDGMYFGDSPDQGIVSGASFRHAGLRIGFDAPPGFRLQNSPQAVAGQGRDGSSFVFAGVPVQPGQPLGPVVDQVWRQIGQGRTPRYQYGERRINSFDAALSSARLRSNRGTVDVGVHVFRVGPDEAYAIRTIAPAGRANQFDGLIASFRRLSANEVAAAGRGRRIDIVTVRPGDTLAGLAARMAPPYNREASVVALNGIQGSSIRPGDRIKLIVG
jgi:predicted Zn-dependent protease